jgi:hypothetical protein
MINEYENLLRTIILEFLKEDVLSYKISEERIAKWIEKREIETKKNKGITFENRLIYYSDFYDLKTIIFKNWELFLPVFLNRKRFEVFFDEVEGYRNTVMHGRNLTKSDSLLLEGILLDQKKLKTIFHNKNEMKEDYFIRIDKVSDSLGNIWTDQLTLNNVVLRVGDEYEVLIEAVDPKGRAIEYEIYVQSAINLVQKENRFNFKITPEFIGQYKSLLITVRTPEAEYKNQYTNSFHFTVLPN